MYLWKEQPQSCRLRHSRRMGAIDGLTWSRRQRDVKESTAVDDVSAGAFQCNALVDCYSDGCEKDRFQEWVADCLLCR